MIALLHGIVLEKEEDRATVEVAGVGYEVLLTTPAAVALRVGQQVRLHTVEVIREDGRELFGFPDADGRGLFRRLIAVSGVGPRTALRLLSIGSPDEVRAAVDAGDVTRLTSVPGVGTKTAQKIVLELRGKLPAAETAEDTDVIEALVGLGYGRNDASRAVTALPLETAGAEARIKAALRSLSKK